MLVAAPPGRRPCSSRRTLGTVLARRGAPCRSRGPALQQLPRSPPAAVAAPPCSSCRGAPCSSRGPALQQLPRSPLPPLQPRPAAAVAGRRRAPALPPPTERRPCSPGERLPFLPLLEGEEVRCWPEGDGRGRGSSGVGSSCAAPFCLCAAPFSPCAASFCMCCPVVPPVSCPVQAVSCPVLPVLPRSARVLPRSARLCPTLAVCTRWCPTRAVISRSCPTRSVLPGLVLPVTPVRPVPYST
ncbi:unnamed protein product [Closterium sp. NIES-65]|nr:unnamed protein product [Closterium sp. NIES-65]